MRNPGTSATGVMLTSKDHGKTFVETAIPLVNEERAPFIAAVDPTNAERVFVRTSNSADKGSRLLVSDDGGKTFRAVFTSKGPLAGFALSRDGKKVWVGGPVDGLQVASTTDFAFSVKSKVEVQCLKLSDDGLWTCSTEKSGFVVGLSRDEGATFETKLHFCDIRGPLTCAEGSTTHTECTLGGTSSTRSPPWPPQRALLGCNVPTPDGGADASADAGPTNQAPGSMDGGGGGCSVHAPSPAPCAALVAGITATIALVRRRRRR